MKKIKILIVDDHKMIRDGLKVMLEMHNDKYSFAIEEAESGEEAIEKVKKRGYDIILLDFQLPGIDGAETAKAIMLKRPESKILALSNYNEYVYIDKMINTGGVKGYILKNVGPHELIKSIETILGDKTYYSNEVAQSLLNFSKGAINYARLKGDKAIQGALSKREVEILKLIAEENTNEQIANKLFISKRTVDKHRQNIMFKLNVRNTAGLVKAAVQLFPLTV